MSKPDTWMPWYVANYLADTTHLTTEQHGAYCLLLMAAWMRAGRLPDDEEELAQIARLDAKRWALHRTKLLKFFDRDSDGYTQKRLSLEYANAVRIYESKVENGRKGGRKPKQKATETKPAGSDSLNPPGELNETQLQPHSPTEKLGGDTPASPAGLACKAMREAGIAAVNPSHPDLMALVEQGVAPQAFADMAIEVFERHGPKPMAYVLTALKNRLANPPAAPIVLNPHRSKRDDERRAVIDGLTGRTSQPAERDITADSAALG